jgi:hypothetical protein
VHQGTIRAKQSPVAQRQSVSNTVLFQQDMQMSEFEDGYRLISGRSQDRNLSGEYTSLSSFTEATRRSKTKKPFAEDYSAFFISTQATHVKIKINNILY